MSLRNALRDVTRVEHEKLDAMLGRLRPFESVERYAVYLCGMQFLYERFAAAMDSCAKHAGQTARSEVMLNALRADLLTCACDGCDDGANIEDTLSSSSSTHWGVTYVLEGSAMGAQMLVREARTQLPASVSCQFLEALAGDGVNRFRAFCAALETQDIESKSAIDGAMQVFGAAIAWYRAHMPEREIHLAT